ncbi:TPA: hypothetical protein HA351_10295 [Methanosarcinaceae archaeon]|nr:hypothetical protein [Methanosarcinaceae archaeon]
MTGDAMAAMIKILEQNTGTKYWNKILEQDTGTKYWKKYTDINHNDCIP